MWCLVWTTIRRNMKPCTFDYKRLCKSRLTFEYKFLAHCQLWEQKTKTDSETYHLSWSLSSQVPVNIIQTGKALMMLIYYVLQYRIYICETLTYGEHSALEINIHFPVTILFTYLLVLYVTDLNECWGCVQTSLSETSHSTTASCPFLFNESQVLPLIPNVAFLAWNISWLCRTLQMYGITLTSQHLNMNTWFLLPIFRPCH
jgi:hypothetical protein